MSLAGIVPKEPTVEKNEKSDVSPVIPGRGPLPANPESVTTGAVIVDSGLAAFAANRNDGAP